MRKRRKFKVWKYYQHYDGSIFRNRYKRLEKYMGNGSWVRTKSVHPIKDFLAENCVMASEEDLFLEIM